MKKIIKNSVYFVCLVSTCSALNLHGAVPLSIQESSMIAQIRKQIPHQDLLVLSTLFEKMGGRNIIEIVGEYTGDWYRMPPFKHKFSDPLGIHNESWSLSADENSIAIASHDHTKFWNITTGEAADKEQEAYVILNPKKDQRAILRHQKSLELRTGETTTASLDTPGSSYSSRIAFTPDGAQLAFYNGNSITTFTTDTLKQVKTLPTRDIPSFMNYSCANTWLVANDARSGVNEVFLCDITKDGGPLSRINGVSYALFRGKILSSWM